MGSLASGAFRRFLESPRAPIWAALIGVLLSSPALFSGFHTEDWTFRAVAPEPPFSLPWSVNLWGLDGRPDDEAVKKIVYEAKRLGALPWFGDEYFHVSLWRPLASWTHHLDFRLFPDSPLLMHAENLAWYGLLVLAVGALYRRVLAAPVFPAWTSGLAVLAYAVDDAHGHAVGWIMNRSAVMAALFGVIAIASLDRWRRAGSRAGAALCSVGLALGLASSEFALGSVGYLIAHAVCLDPGRPLRRCLVSLVWLIPLALWAIAYRALGHGAWESGLYVDPLSQPLVFAQHVLEHGSVLLLAQLGFPPSDLFLSMAPARALLMAGAAASALIGLAALIWPLLRARREVSFWALGTLLSVVPISAGFPEDRMLLLTGVGGMGLFASLVAAATEFDWRTRLRRRAVPALAVLLALLHLVIAPVLLPLRALTMWRYERALARARDSAFALVEFPQQELVLLNAPDAYFASMLVLTRAARHERLPALTLCLNGSLEPLQIRRDDPYTLELVPRAGFITPGFNEIYRAPRRPIPEGHVFWFPAFQVRVDRVSQAGEPLSARFRFRWPLDAPRMVFAVFRDGRYQRIAMPAIGETRWIETQ